MKKRFPVQVVVYYDGHYRVLDNVIAIGFYYDQTIFEIRDSDGFYTLERDSDGFYTLALDSSNHWILAVNDLE